MKITAVRTIPLRGAPQDTEPMHTLVEIHTDEGLTGFGSCFNQELEPQNESGTPGEPGSARSTIGEPWRSRTSNLLIKSQLLCQLS